MFDANGKPADVTELKHDICDRLDAYLQVHTSAKFDCVSSETASARSRTLKTLRALHTLAHESWYLADDCRDGGPLDLRPQSSLWP